MLLLLEARCQAASRTLHATIMPRIDIDLSWAITTLDLPGSVDIHACQRVSYTSLLPPGRHTLADVVELAKRRLNVIRAGGGLGYIGATRDALDRFHGVNAHFPLRQRFMEVLAFADTSEIIDCESACLPELLPFGGLTNYPASKGGEHIPRTRRPIYLYVCSTDFSGKCGCHQCAPWENRDGVVGGRGGRRGGGGGGALPKSKAEPLDSPSSCASAILEPSEPSEPSALSNKRQRVAPSEFVSNLSFSKIKDRLAGDPMSTQRFRNLLHEHFPRSVAANVEAGFQEYIDTCLTMHCVVGRGFFANRLQMYARSGHPGIYAVIVEKYGEILRDRADGTAERPRLMSDALQAADSKRALALPQ